MHLEKCLKKYSNKMVKPKTIVSVFMIIVGIFLIIFPEPTTTVAGIILVMSGFGVEKYA